MGDTQPLKLTKTLYQKFKNILTLLLIKLFSLLLLILNEIVKIHFGALHDNESKLFPSILVQLKLGEKIAFVLDDGRSVGREFLHEGYFFEKIPVLVISLDLNFLHCTVLASNEGCVDTSIALSDLFDDL